MGGERFTEEDDKFILENYGKMNTRTIAMSLGRTTGRSITNRYKRLMKKDTAIKAIQGIEQPQPVDHPMFGLIKSSHGHFYITSRREFANIFNKSIGDPKIVLIKFDSIIELIKDDYAHNDLCMSELIRGNWMDKVDLEDIGVLLHWAGEEDMLSDFACNE